MKELHTLTFTDEYGRPKTYRVTMARFEELMDDPSFVCYVENLRLDGECVDSSVL